MPREQSTGKADFRPESEDLHKEKTASLDVAKAKAGESPEEERKKNPQVEAPGREDLRANPNIEVGCRSDAADAVNNTWNQARVPKSMLIQAQFLLVTTLRLWGRVTAVFRGKSGIL